MTTRPTSAKKLKDQRARYLQISQALLAKFGQLTWAHRYPPVDELVDCILSQSTTDANRDRGFAALKANFPSWEAVRDADTQAVIDAIRPAGLANQKGPRIQNALRYITAQRGAITLDFLTDLPVAEAKAWLMSIDGVGPKTAAIVLCFAFNKPAFPVDTHIHRVGQRIGFIGPKVSADKAHAIMEAIVPAEEYYAGHLNIIQLGRTICQARNAHCDRCVITQWCDFYQQTALKNLPPPKK
jgi:endonuclease III